MRLVKFTHKPCDFKNILGDSELWVNPDGVSKVVLYNGKYDNVYFDNGKATEIFLCNLPEGESVVVDEPIETVVKKLTNEFYGCIKLSNGYAAFPEREEDNG